MLNIKKLLNTEPTANELAEIITSTKAELDGVINEIDTLNVQRRIVLLNGTDDDLQKHDDNINAEMTKRDRLTVMIEELEQQHATQVQNESDAELDHVLNAGERASEDGVKAIKRYGELAKEMADIMNDLQTIDVVVNTANLAASNAGDPRRIDGPNTRARKVPDQVTAAHTKVIPAKAEGFDDRTVNVSEQRTVGVERKSLLDTVVVPAADYSAFPLWPTTTWPLDERIAHKETVDQKVADYLT